MTEIIATSFLIGAAASYPLLRWARTKSVEMRKLEYLCTMKLLPLFPIGLAALMCVIYSPAYTIVVMMHAAIVALLTAKAVGQSQYNKRSFTSLMTGAREEEVNVDRVKRWISAMHAFALVLLLGIVGAEIALWDSPSRVIVLPFPKLYAFLGGKRAANVLLDTIAREDKRFAVDAAIILIEMGKEDEIVRLKENAVPVLAALLYYTDDLQPGDLLYPPRLNDGSIRGKAAGMLARIGRLRRVGRPARFALLRALKDDISDVRALAAAALVEIGDKTAIPDIEDADRRIHYVKLGAELSCEICNAIEQLKSK